MKKNMMECRQLTAFSHFLFDSGSPGGIIAVSIGMIPVNSIDALFF